MLADDIEWMLPSLRAEANARMTEVVQAGNFRDSTDEETGNPVTVPVGDLIYDGIARVRYQDNAVRDADSASQIATAQDVSVSLPWGSVALPEGTRVLVTQSKSDPALVGRSYTVDGAAAMGQTTAHRYPVTELT